MKLELIVKKLDAKQNGSFFKIRWFSEIPLCAAAKKEGMTAYKMTDAVCRKGIQYRNQRSVQMKEEEGKIPTHKLPWGNWDPNHPKLVIDHNGKKYIRLYPAPNKPKCSYMLNGVECSYEELKASGYVLPSWLKKRENGEKPDAFMLKPESIQEIF